MAGVGFVSLTYVVPPSSILLRWVRRSNGNPPPVGVEGKRQSATGGRGFPCLRTRMTEVAGAA